MAKPPKFNDAQAHTEHLRRIAQAMSEALPGLGFALIVFEFGKPGRSDYISNGNRQEMITALRECADNLENKKDFKIPQKN